MTESKSFEYPDLDFNDFDKDKNESCFKVGQVWVVYDTLDGMPRFYGIIREILSPKFQLRITWLEPEPLNEAKWLYEGFLASCGRLRIGNLEHIGDHLMFSHLVCVKNGNNNDAIKIFPLKGETSALLKDWDSKNLNYEYVEVLSNYNESIGVHVAYLDKTKVFTCLFHRIGDPFLVLAKGMFRFSHRIPSMKMTGTERDDVPERSFELDPTSLPIYQVDVFASSIDQSAIANFMDFVHSAENWVAPIPNQVPNSKFYRFAAERSPENFQISKCWAIYNDEDALPRYYGLRKKIDLLPQFVLHVAWFYACPLPKNVKFLEWIKGFKSVYNARVEEEEADKVVKICVSEHLKFSHRIPAFRLIEERGESLRGFWELDLAGMPLCLLCTD
ncbi:hypothetical protein R3W88_001143 [Solanum pinnatisectum]|uniref:DUF3444 domain-containing protein n=1 Tax=Solanum pinnatisectum TaxID=50273 RepID=A0AAV9MI65_9SOLN|nr:hypothetical protein R3W88_001143 [Solanum pinnatisectum]